MSEPGEGEAYAVVQPFPYDADDEMVRSARGVAVLRWYDETEAFDGDGLGAPTVTRLDPPLLDGKPLAFSYEDQDGDIVESPPMSAWRVEGLVRRP